MKPMPADLRGITVDGWPESLEGVRGRLQAILDGLGEGERVQQVLMWWKPDRLAEDGTVIEDGGPIAVVAITRAGSDMKAHVVALCNNRPTAEAVVQYAKEFFWRNGGWLMVA